MPWGGMLDNSEGASTVLVQHNATCWHVVILRARSISS